MWGQLLVVTIFPVWRKNEEEFIVAFSGLYPVHVVLSRLRHTPPTSPKSFVSLLPSLEVLEPRLLGHLTLQGCTVEAVDPSEKVGSANSGAVASRVRTYSWGRCALE